MGTLVEDEDLPIWKAALELAQKIYSHTRDKF